MANTDAAFGLRPVRYLNGAPWNGKVRPYFVPGDYATALYIGDPVVIVGDSNDNVYRGFQPGGLSEINLGSAGDAVAITGVIVGFEPTTHLSNRYKPASTEALAYVCDDPNVVFQIQDDGGGTPSVDWVGLNANLISGTGSTSTGLSGWELDGGTSDGPAADPSNQLIILGLANIDGNEVDADNAVWEVLINQHTYRVSNAVGVA